MGINKNIFSGVLLAVLIPSYAFSCHAGGKGRADSLGVQVFQGTSASNRQIGPALSGWGIGVKLGAPTGFSFKYYMQEGTAWEVIIGRSGRRIEKYDDDFKEDIDHGDDHEDEYLTINDHTAYSFQGNFLKHYQLDIGRIRNLFWYFGVGGQMRLKTFEYVYDEHYPQSGGGIRTTRKTENATDIDLGADFLLGLEYRLRNPDIAFSLDAGGFVELIDDPLEGIEQGGLGVRYNF